MTIGNAMTFIDRGMKEETLRKRLNAAPCELERQDVLNGEALLFSAHDFDEAFHHRLTQCQEREDAERLREFKLWWDLLQQTRKTADCRDQCRGVCE
jgi:hypothetical protein